MIKLNEAKFTENATDNLDLINELQNVLNTEIKNLLIGAKSTFGLDVVDEKNILKNYCAFSKINKELYILMKFKSNSSTTSSFSYSLLTFSLDTNTLKSNKIMKFFFDQRVKKNSDLIKINQKSEFNFEIKEIILHPINQNQLCMFGEEYLAFISDLKNFTKNERGDKFEKIQDSNATPINIIHTSLLEKDFTSKNPDHKFTKFKFSEFDNYFGVVLKDNTFRFYNMNSSITQNFISFNSHPSNHIVDFAFSPLSDFGWQNFSVFFLDKSGGISYVCPIFPEIFEIKETFLTQMNKFHKNLRIVEESNENMMNENILYHLENSIVNYEDDGVDAKSFKMGKIHKQKNLNLKNSKVTIKIDEYLKNFNKKSNLVNLITIDKRRSVDLLVLSEGEKISYNQLFIVSSYPLTFLRVSESNLIDIIICHEEITPNRKNLDERHMKNFFSDSLFEENSRDKEIGCFLVETIQFKLFEKRTHTGLKIIRGDIEENTNIHCYVNILSNLYKIEFTYLNRINYYLKNFNGKDDLNIGQFISEVSEILSFEYDLRIKPKIPYGYFCLEKIDHTFLIISVMNPSANDFSFLVREIEDFCFDNKINNKPDSEIIFNQNLNEFLQIFESKLQKLEMNLKSGKTDLDLSNLEKIMDKRYD
jgi:hypothetical protein